MNIVLILTDQERAIQHFPPNWLRQNLPGMRRLRQHGLSFERAFTNACMCSPARSTLMSGFFPAQHGVKYTLEEDMPFPEYPHQVELPRPPEMANLATVMRAAGYNVIYKGKWHCSKPAEKENAKPSDLERYGFTRWNPPDAGANQTVPEAGGGFIDNDGRFMESTGSTGGRRRGRAPVPRLGGGQTAALLPGRSRWSTRTTSSSTRARPSKKPATTTPGCRATSTSPATNEEDLSTKPTVQEQFLRIFNLTGKPKTEKEKRAYLNYYGNLMRSSDNYIVNVLNKLEETGLYDDTLIVRTADHGEMGLTHGGMRQKNFNFYEEATRVPLVYSNPKLFPTPQSTDALVSHVDFLPTLASLAKAPKSARADWQGVDYSQLVLQAEERQAGPGLRRLHLRRLPVRPGEPAVSETAEPHRLDPRRALEAGPLLRRQQSETEAAAVGDVRPEDRPAGEEEPRLRRLRTLCPRGGPVPAPEAKAGAGRKDPVEDVETRLTAGPRGRSV